MEAAVLLAKCSKRKMFYGIRVQKMNDGDWMRTWAFPIDEKRAKKEGYDKTVVIGSLDCTDTYPGCPYCKTKHFYVCGNCGKIVCYNSENEAYCPWCNYYCDEYVESDVFEFSGGDI